MSFVYGGFVWPAAVYYHWPQAYEFDYMYPFAAQPMSHVDIRHYPALGEDWLGMHIYENCKYCWQPLVATSDPRVNYCPSCGRSQWHRL
jgi:hypothetical protein